MNQNLDSLKNDIQQYLEEEHFLVFHGYAQPLEPSREVRWNTTTHNDYRAFLKVAQEAGVRLVVFYSAQFNPEAVDEAMEQMEDSDLPREEVRRFERRLRELRAYEGFTHEIELSFDYEGRTYVFELQTEWYSAFQDLLDELDLALPDGEDDEDGPMGGGFFSNN